MTAFYPADKAYLVGFGIEAILYGLYLVLFSFSLALLLWRRRTDAVNWPMLLMTCALFVGSTVHFGMNFDNVVSAFITRRDEPGGPAVIVEEPQFDLRIDVMFSVNNVLGDLVLVYRCWLVWQRNWRIVALPLVMLIVYFLSAVIGLYHLSRIGDGGDQFSATVDSFGTASFTLSLCLNAVVTALIASRIYYFTQRGREHDALPRRRARQYMHVVAIIVESGAIFCAAQVLFVVLWSVHSNAHWIGAHPAAQIYCIVPTLIIVRVGMGLASEQTTQLTSTKFSTHISAHDVNPPSDIVELGLPKLRFVSTDAVTRSSGSGDKVEVVDSPV